MSGAAVGSGLTIHPQVRCLNFECDEELTELLWLMNKLGVRTIMSCQDAACDGNVRRVWVDMRPTGVTTFLNLINDPGELDDVESLSNRMAAEWEPEEWQDFRANRSWHWEAHVNRLDGRVEPPSIGVRFPYTDLPEVVRRLRGRANGRRR